MGQQVDEFAYLSPGRGLDVGSGEDSDTVWLACPRVGGDRVERVPPEFRS